MSGLEEKLLDNGLEGTVYFVNEDYADAILGYTENGSLVYSYNKMIEYLMREDGMDEVGAQEWIDYNVIRSIPYMGDKAPIIVYELV